MYFTMVQDPMGCTRLDNWRLMTEAAAARRRLTAPRTSAAPTALQLLMMSCALAVLPGVASEGGAADAGLAGTEGAAGAEGAVRVGLERKTPSTQSTLGYEFASAESEASYEASVSAANAAWAKDNPELHLPSERSRNHLCSYAAFASRKYNVDICNAEPEALKSCFEGFLGAFAAAQKAKKGIATAGTLGNLRSEIATAFVWLTQRDAPPDVFNGKKTKLFQGQVRAEMRAAGVSERRAAPLNLSSLIVMGREVFTKAVGVSLFSEKLILLRDHAALLVSSATATRMVDPSLARLGDLQIVHQAGAPFGTVLVWERRGHKASLFAAPDPLFVLPVLGSIEACALLFLSLWLFASWPLRQFAASAAGVSIEMTLLFPSQYLEKKRIVFNWVPATGTKTKKLDVAEHMRSAAVAGGIPGGKWLAGHAGHSAALGIALERHGNLGLGLQLANWKSGAALSYVINSTSGRDNRLDAALKLSGHPGLQPSPIAFSGSPYARAATTPIECHTVHEYCGIVITAALDLDVELSSEAPMSEVKQTVMQLLAAAVAASRSLPTRGISTVGQEVLGGFAELIARIPPGDVAARSGFTGLSLAVRSLLQPLAEQEATAGRLRGATADAVVGPAAIVAQHVASEQVLKVPARPSFRHDFFSRLPVEKVLPFWRRGMTWGEDEVLPAVSLFDGGRESPWENKPKDNKSFRVYMSGLGLGNNLLAEGQPV